MTPLSQRDSRWKNIKLGTSDTTIGGYGLKVFSFGVIFKGVFASAQKLQIFYSIIRSIMVYMVDCFISFKLSAYKFFHNISMLKISFAICGNKNISIFSKRSFWIPSGVIFSIVSFYFRLVNWICFTMTRKRTILKCLPSFTNNLNFLSTPDTGKTRTAWTIFRSISPIKIITAHNTYKQIVSIVVHSNSHYSTQKGFCL